MRVYLVWASCLVDTCVLRWLVVAHGEREAWEKGYSLVRNCSVADEGAWDIKRVSSAIKVVEYIEQGVKICE